MRDGIAQQWRSYHIYMNNHLVEQTIRFDLIGEIGKTETQITAILLISLIVTCCISGLNDSLLFWLTKESQMALLMML